MIGGDRWVEIKGRKELGAKQGKNKQKKVLFGR